MTGLAGAKESTSTLHRDSYSAPFGSAQSSLKECTLVFAGAFLVLFLLSNRFVNLYDEGLLLTAVMRTMAGQVLHRDFYYNYGPGQLYLLAGLFKVFGTSVLVERLTFSFAASGLVLSTYVLAHKFCSRAISFAVAVLCLLWILGEFMRQGLMNPLIPALALWACWMVVPVNEARLQRRRAAIAGVLSGILFLFRYDMGIGLAVANLFGVGVVLWLRDRDVRRAARSLATRILWPYAAGFAIVSVPPMLAYLSVAPLHDLLYDIVLYSSKYYRVARRLPFPTRHSGRQFEDFVVYVLPLLMALSVWAAYRWMSARRRSEDEASATPESSAMLILLSVAAAMMYVKGLVRVGAGQMNSSTLLCVLLAAILFQYRRKLETWVRIPFAAAAIVLLMTAVSAAMGKVETGGHLQPMMINWLAVPNRQPPSPPLKSWCQFDEPVTRGMCFVMDPDHIQAVEYLVAHTTPSDTLYVGLSHHDRIFINDNATYFAAQRLPATKWSHFDPFLQNREDIQTEMIGELERNRPPYVVLDSEFDKIREPNASSISTGVHLLDDYIAAHYTLVQTFGELTILKRN